MLRCLTLGLLFALAAACGDDEGQSSPTAVPSRPAQAESTAPAAGSPQAPPATPAPTPIVIESLPVVDMHFHPDAAWDLAALLALMDQLGVSQAVGGSGGTGADALDFASRHPERFVPFAGQDAVRALYVAEGTAAINLQSERALRHVAGLEAELKAGCWRGIGELFVNTLASHRTGALRMPADSPLLRRLWELSAAYNVPLSVHMDADPVSVAEMRRLLASNPNGTWIWAHSGWYASPALLRELLQAHPNLYLELSFRDEPRSFSALSTGGTLTQAWRDLLEELPERFLLGTDLLPPPTAAKYSELIRFWRGVLAQLSPESAALLAHRNAEGLLARVPPFDAVRCAALRNG
jgi:hypothetical protein